MKYVPKTYASADKNDETSPQGNTVDSGAPTTVPAATGGVEQDIGGKKADEGKPGV